MGGGTTGATAGGEGPRPLGFQLVADLYGCDPLVLDDLAAIEGHLLAAAAVARATVIDARFHRFAPQGVSGVVVIAESHLAIHTWPEHGYAALDLFTCGASLDRDGCLAYLRAKLGAKRVETLDLPRGDLGAIRLPAAGSHRAEEPRSG